VAREMLDTANKVSGRNLIGQRPADLPGQQAAEGESARREHAASATDGDERGRP